MKRVLSRIPGGGAHWGQVVNSLGKLATPGDPLIVRIGSHDVGLVRPYVLGDLTGESVRMICLPKIPGFVLPVVVGQVEIARGFVRRVKLSSGIAHKRWVAYEGERAPPAPAESLFNFIADGSVVLRTGARA